MANTPNEELEALAPVPVPATDSGIPEPTTDSVIPGPTTDSVIPVLATDSAIPVPATGSFIPGLPASVTYLITDAGTAATTS